MWYLSGPSSFFRGHASRQGPVERFLLRVIGLIVLLLVVTQYMLGGITEQVVSQVGSREDVQSNPGAPEPVPTHVVTLQLNNFSTLPRAKVLVNQEVRGEFRDRYVTVAVRNGDTIEVDGTFYSHPVEIVVLDVSPGVLAPSSGQQLKLQGGVTKVGTVRISEDQ